MNINAAKKVGNCDIWWIDNYSLSAFLLELGICWCTLLC